jgi:hypothetical protein
MLGYALRFSRFPSLSLALLCLVAVDAARAQDITTLPQNPKDKLRAKIAALERVACNGDADQGSDQLRSVLRGYNAKYVGFVPPNRERFYRNYGFGVRLTTFDRDLPLAAPATYTLLFGQDEAITGGHLQSVVGKIDVFYPLPISGTGGAYKFVYLFGNANLRLSKATSIPTFALQNPNANGVTVQPFDPNLAIITVPSKRDTYRIGAGIDMVNLIQTIQTKGKQAATP